MKQPIFLRILLGDKLQNVAQFTDGQVVIGKNSDVQIPLTAEGVAPLHAVIEYRDTGYYISDLGSPFGTLKNGTKVFDEKLNSGDELQIGPYKLEFFIGVPKPAGVPDVIPTSVVQRESAMKKNSSKKTMAPADKPGRLVDSLKKSHGNVVEVVIAWGERVVSTHHFESAGEVTIGSDPSNTIVMPLPGSNVASHPLLILSQTVRVCLTPDMVGDYYNNETHSSFGDLIRKGRVIQIPSGSVIDITAGEMVRIQVHGGVLNIYVRFIPETAKPIAAPLFDLTRSERTAVIMSAVVTAFFALILTLYSPSPLEEEANLEEPLRKVTVLFKVPKAPPEPVTVDDIPKEKKIVKVEEKKKVAQTTKQDPGTASELKPNKTNKKVDQVSGAVDKGAAIKTGTKEGANTKSQNRDVTKEGLLSVFGGQGAQKELSKAYSGSGELQGMADSATGTSGSNESRTGDNLGGRVKNLGVGGKGSSNVGYSGIGTKGKGSGTFGLGTGGIGAKGKEDINIEGADAEFSGSIDRDAIRRVIQENKRAFKYCYDTALRRNSDLYGKVEIQWDIIERGRATNAFVKSNSTGDKDLGKCIVGKISGLTFPEPPSDQVARVVYPFVFTAQ